jgi:hypothetical protein
MRQKISARSGLFIDKQLQVLQLVRSRSKYHITKNVQCQNHQELRTGRGTAGEVIKFVSRGALAISEIDPSFCTDHIMEAVLGRELTF